MGLKKSDMAKETVSFTLEKELIKRLNSYSNKYFINKSKLVESLLEEFLSNKKKED